MGYYIKNIFTNRFVKIEESHSRLELNFVEGVEQATRYSTAYEATNELLNLKLSNCTVVSLD